MQQKETKLYSWAPLENNDLEKRLETKLNDMNSFNASVVNIEEVITYFKDKT